MWAQDQFRAFRRTSSSRIAVMANFHLPTTSCFCKGRARNVEGDSPLLVVSLVLVEVGAVLAVLGGEGEALLRFQELQHVLVLHPSIASPLDSPL